MPKLVLPAGAPLWRPSERTRCTDSETSNLMYEALPFEGERGGVALNPKAFYVGGLGWETSFATRAAQAPWGLGARYLESPKP